MSVHYKDLIAPRFEAVDDFMRQKLVKRLAQGWPSQQAPSKSAVKPETAERLFQDVLLHCAQTSTQKDFPSLIHCSEIVFTDSDGDYMKLNHRGVPRVNDVIFRMVGSTFAMLRPVLQEYGFQVDATGLAQLLATLYQLADNPKLTELLVRSLYALLMGGEAAHIDLMQVTFTERYTSHMIWMGIMSGNLSYNATWLYYLQHLGLPPLERSWRSAPRSMAFIELLMQPILDLANLWRKPRVFWVIGASDAIEGQQARSGFFEDLRVFRDMKVTVCLIGVGMPSDPTPGMNLSVKVLGFTWEDAALSKVPHPTMVFVFNSGLGTFDTSGITVSVLSSIIGLSFSAVPPAFVTTCRCEAEAAAECAILQVIGTSIAMPSREKKHLRNIISGMAGHPDIDYDDNGWWVASMGNSLPREIHADLSAWATRPEAPEGPYEKARAYLVPPLQEAPTEPTPAAEPQAPADAPDAAASTPAEKAAAEADDATPASGAPDSAADVAQPEELASADDAQEAAKSQQLSKSPAVFWGILDLKYDAERLPGDKVKVLETGDGRTSRFSGYGASIKEAFQQDSRLQETLQRSVLTENKKLTHDTIVDAGYSHLRPRQIPFPREYSNSLAESIVAAFGFSQDDACVLKLCNRTRGAGVIPVLVAELDTMLKRLLTPPDDVPTWFSRQPVGWAIDVQSGCFEEQVRHWWSNECPIFVVEELCYSMPTEKEGKHYDGTMRVGFSLHREERRLHLVPAVPGDAEGGDKPGGDDTDDEGHQANPRARMNRDVVQESMKVWDEDRPYMEIFRPQVSILRVQWLGGYWKLPIEDVGSEDLRGKIVSVAKQGTAPVPLSQLHEVYASLGDMVARLFGAKEMSNAGLVRRYNDWPEFGAFAVSRLACSMRARDRGKSHGLLQLAQANLSRCTGTCKDLVDSYIVRNLGVYQALQGSWASAQEEFVRALRSMPSNATARFLLGIAHMELNRPEAAISSMEEALLLDPDFKAPYAGLGALRLRKGDYQRAADISSAGLARHPYTPQCSYNLGLANFALACMREETFTKLWVSAAKPLSVMAAAVAAQARPQPNTLKAQLAADPQQPNTLKAKLAAEPQLPKVRPMAPEARFEVVHNRVLVRATPSRSARVLGVAVRGRPIYAMPCEVEGEAWIRIRNKACEELGLDVGEAWMLMNGKCFGLKALVAEVPSTAKEVVVLVRNEEKGGQLRLRLGVAATIKEVREVIGRELGKAHFAAPLWRKVGTNGPFRCEDGEMLGACDELLVKGKALVLPRLAFLSAPSNGAGSNGKPEAASASPSSGATPGAEESPVSRQLIEAFMQEALSDALLQQLRAAALEALETARSTRTRDLPWTERDDRILTQLRDAQLLRWPKEELPRDGWRVLNFRP